MRLAMSECLDAAEHDLDTSVGEDGVEQFGELAVRSRIRYLALDRASSRSMARFLATCRCRSGRRARRGS
jgi:hypothetical protein